MTAYVIANVHVTNPDAYQEYSTRVAATVAGHGGAFLARGGRAEILDGDGVAGREVVIRFDSYEAAQRWYSSPEYQEILPIRLANSTGRVALVEGT